VLALLEGIETPHVLDVGTGSGAIALAIASERPDARVTATDLSPDALALARENAERLGLAVDLVETNLLDGIAGPFELVVSNPPYIPLAEIDALQPEVRDWEPRAALLAERHTDAIARAARDVLVGWLVLEVHEQQATEVVAALAELGYDRATITRDLAGKDRVVEARWPTTSSRR
jgi:release factor glutamine methyltransferase